MTIISSGGAVVGAGEVGAYQIERSLRFNSADSAYLERTPGTASNRKTWTWSAWVKLTLTSDARLFAARVDNNNRLVVVYTFGQANLQVSNVESGIATVWTATNALLRDPSAWYHFVVAFDSTQATATNRLKVYINGVEQTFSTDNRSSITQNYDGYVNDNIEHYIGSATGSNSSDCYLTEIHFIDGQALDETDFGEFSPTTGVWGPIAYTGTYGTNGWFLNFSDNSGTTSTTLGKDQVGSNNWTPNNFSVTAGAGNDSLVDTCTLFGTDTGIGGQVRGNYCTWNPLAKSDNHTVSNGNLDISSSGATSFGAICATVGASSGKWYWEMLYNRSNASNSPVVGFGNDLFNYRNPPSGFLGSDLNGGGINVINGSAQINATSTAYGSAIATNDIVIFAMDLDNRKFYIGKNGTFFNSGDPVAGTNSWPFSATIVGSTFFPAANIFNNSAQTNFGQRAFEYTAPSGFKALVTTNLPDPTVIEGDEYFNTVLYTGTGSSLGVTGVGFQPDWVWIKERSGAADHGLYDAVRGVQNQLESNTTTAETAEATGLTAFGTDGFTVGALAQLNTSGDTYVAWNWKANGAGVSNTDGTITSTVSANTDAGFSIVTYTGTGSAATVGHGLGVAPNVLIIKNRTSAGEWVFGHSSLGFTKFIELNSTGAEQTNSARFNDTAPTSSVFSIGNALDVNTNGNTLVAYCFAAIPGYSAFGSYTGNGSADGPFVFLGFRPAWVLIKQSSAAGENWRLIDSTRSPFNQANRHLAPSSSAAEATETGWDIVSNGFKLRNSDAHQNGNGATYIYACFAENPFKFALAR